MDKQWLRSLRRRIAKAPTGPRGRRRYSDSLREEILTFATGWLETGGTRAELARQIGMTEQTLANWLKRDIEEEAQEAEPPAKSLVRSVQLREDVAADGSFSVALPTGARIEGLSLHDVVELVREVR